MATNSTIIPWQVLDLVANNLDPKTLALASCVSKSWSSAMSSDHLWEHLCTTQLPSLTHLRSTAAAASPCAPLPYRRLYGLGLTSAKRRHRTPQKPKIPLENLLFVVTVDNSRAAPVTLVKPGAALGPADAKSMFRFDFDVRGHERWLRYEVLEETRVTWNVVLGGFEGVFTMMDCKGKGSFVSGSDGWFSAELPGAGCCCAGGGSGMVADMRLVMKEEGGRRVVERVSVGVLSIVSWRYVGVDDGLRYLEHFLQPCDV